MTAPLTPEAADKFKEIREDASAYNGEGSRMFERADILALLASRDALAERVKVLEGALEEIKTACVEGRVCDDVAWFRAVPSETLYDYCCNALSRTSDGASGG